MIWLPCLLLWWLPLPLLPAQGSLLCNSINITSVEDFVLLNRCTVVVGHVSITNVQFPTTSDAVADFRTAVQEITDYLLVYRAHGLTSLQQIFPQLVVVRGRELLLQKYALLVYENRDLRDLGLGALLRVQSGAIRVESNPVLCFVDTVNWVQLLGNSTQQHFALKKNKPPNYCPLCVAQNEAGDGTGHCWNLHTRQRVPNAGDVGRPCPRKCASGCDVSSGVCCSASCLSGCSETDCDLCADYRNSRKCMDTCRFPYYEFNKRECVAAEVCRKHHLMPFAGVCVKHCPPHYRVVYDALGLPTCGLLCSGNYTVHTARDLPSLEDCKSIQGSLTLELKELKSNIIQELERSLRNLKEITGYLKITRSPQLLSLNFLHNLDTIGGNELVANKFALYIVDNHHLEQLWTDNHRIAILKGRVYFHLNPRLCHEKIMQLESSLKSVAKISIEDASPNSNGERVICGNNVRVLNATVEELNATAALIKVNPMAADDLDVLIGYLHHYKEAPQRNVTMYDGRHGCGHDNWHMDISTNQNVRHILSNLKPYTQYAYFVKTLTRTDYHTQIDAYSEIQYFRTLPSKPGPVAKVYYRSASATDVIVHWWPPRNPNGQLQKYLVFYEEAALQHHNTTKTTKNYPPAPQATNSKDVCQCNATNPELSGSSPADENYYNKEMVTYDEALPNLIYVPRTLETPAKNKPPIEPNETTQVRSRSRRGSDDVSQTTTTAQQQPNPEHEGNSERPEDEDSKARRLYDNYRLEMERNALLKQDTGAKDFPILKPAPVCSVTNPTTQYQLENRCRPQELYRGTSVPAYQHHFALHNLAPEKTYRISIRACVADLENACGCETALLAETVSKRMETFLREFRAMS